MAEHTVNLTPKFINLVSEGGLDGSILNGKSYQRTLNMYEVETLGNRKMINSVSDGDSFNDTTFENSVAEGTFESSLIFKANQVLDAGTSYDENGFVGVGAIVEISQDQASVLNSYGYFLLFFNAKWNNGSYSSESNLLVFPAYGNTFEDVVVIIPLDNMGNPICDSLAVWNMPVELTNFIEGFNP